MSVSQQIAKHFKEIYFGGNWTESSLKEQTGDITWKEATSQVYSINTIASLVFHINYYVTTVLKVLKDDALSGSDAFAFDHPPIQSEEDWQNMLQKTWSEGAEFATIVEQFPDERLWTNMADEKYGSWYRNLHGIIEHAHYHLGQIAVLKKIIRGNAQSLVVRS